MTRPLSRGWAAVCATTKYYMMNASFRDATVGSAAVSEGAGGGSFIRRDGALPVPSDPMNHPPHALAAPDPMGTVGAVGLTGFTGLSATFADRAVGAGAEMDTDTRTKPERALAAAMKLIALKSSKASRDDAPTNLALPATPAGAAPSAPVVQGGTFASVDEAGNVYADYAKVEAMTEEAVEAALAEIPDEDGREAANPMAAFQAAFQTRIMREQLKEQVRTEVQNKAKVEVRQIQRKFLMAVEAAKPKKPQAKGALMQAAFLAAHDKARSAVAAQNAHKMSLLTVPDPYDESLFGVTNLALYQSRNNLRVTQQVLEYVLGYSSVVDPEDVEEIEAGSQGLQVSRGKGMKELALKYAQHLDKTLPTRHASVLKALIRRAADEHSRAVRMGQAAEDAFNAREHESCSDVKALNRDVWLKEMFPDAAWPAPRRVGAALGAGTYAGQNDPLDSTASAAAIAAAAGEDYPFAFSRVKLRVSASAFSRVASRWVCLTSSRRSTAPVANHGGAKACAHKACRARR